jgi:hypothetical protein
MRTEPVAFPEAGAKAVLRFTVDDLESLELDFGGAWLAIVVGGLGDRDPSPVIVARCMALALKGEDEDAGLDAPWGLTPKDLAVRLLDALHRVIHGKTTDELKEAKAAADRVAARKVAETAS